MLVDKIRTNYKIERGGFMNNKPEVTMQQFLIWLSLIVVAIVAVFCGAALILSSTVGGASEIPGRIWSWLYVEDVWFMPSVALTCVFAYVWLKTYLPIWAKADRYYFTSVDEEKKEIKVVSLAGKVEGFLGPDYNYKSGSRVVRKPRPKGFYQSNR